MSSRSQFASGEYLHRAGAGISKEMIYVRGAALTTLIAALEFAGRPCEVIGIEQLGVTREQIAVVLEFVADNRRSDVPPVLLLFDDGHAEGPGASAVRSHGAHGAVQRWHRLRNGELLNAGERARFDRLLTTAGASVISRTSASVASRWSS